MDRAYPDRILYYTGWKRARYPVQCVLTALTTVFWGTAALLISLFGRRGPWVHACARNWGASILGICRVRVEAEGLDKLDPEINYVVMSNHHSLFDIPTVLSTLPFPFRMLAKASLFRVPFMGWYMSRVGYIPVEREDPRQARQSLEEAGRRVAAGLSVLIFPEGTRSPEGEVRRFKRGGFHLARAAGVPVVPVAIVNSGRLLPRGSWHADPGVIRLRVGDPLDPARLPDPMELENAVRDEILELKGHRPGATGPRDTSSQGTVSRETTSREATSREPVSQEAASQEPASEEAASQKTTSRETTSRGKPSREEGSAATRAQAER